MVPSLLVFGVIPSLSVISKPLQGQNDKMASLSMAPAEMPTVTAELRTLPAIMYILPPAAHLKLKPGSNVRVYCELERR